tara:strand:+ start:1157 stop:1789 length:633 start_codon:yes stop_codon:yes gene_type:complete
VFTSPPDAEEIEKTLEDWEIWFRNAISLCFKSSLGPVVFYVTDRKSGGRIHSKAGLIFSEAAKCGSIPAWHKICLRRDVGQIDIHRPTFTHLLAFNGLPGKASSDVIQRGKTVYKNGTGLVAARVGVEWIKKQAESITDPFCGQGTIIAVAEALGVRAIGIDIDEMQCKKARQLYLRHIDHTVYDVTLESDGTKFDGKGDTFSPLIANAS